MKTPGKAKRIGRPMKAPTEKRVQIGPLIRASIKKRIDEAAMLSGRTISQEAEFLIERGLIADEIAKLSDTTQEDIHRMTLLAVMNRSGFAPDYGVDANGKKIIVQWRRRKLGGFVKEDKK